MGYIMAFVFGFSGSKLFLKNIDNLKAIAFGIDTLIIFYLILRLL